MFAAQTSAAQIAPSAEAGVWRGYALAVPEGPQWALAHDAVGRVYSAGEVVAVFDGVEWLRLTTPGSGPVRGLAVDGANRVWIGNATELGCHEPQPDGAFRFRSLRDKIPEQHREFGQIMAVHVIGDAVFFLAPQKLFRWRGETMDVWPMESGRRLFASSVGEELWIHARATSGLWRIGASDPAPTLVAPSAGVLTNFGIVGVRPMPDGSWLLFSTTNGVHRLVAGGVPERAAWGDRSRLDTALINSVYSLPGGQLALAGISEGVTFLSGDGQPLARISAAEGVLPDDRVNDLHLMPNGRLWVATMRGLAVFDADNRVTLFRESSGLRGQVNDVVRHDGRLRVATDVGTARMSAAKVAAASPRFDVTHPIEIKQLVPALNGLLGIGVNGLIRLREDGEQESLSQEHHWALAGGTAVAVVAPARYGVSTLAGLAILSNRDAQAPALTPWVPLPAARRWTAENEAAGTWLVSTARHEVWRLRLTDDRSAMAAPAQRVLSAEESGELFQVFPEGDASFALTGRGVFRLARDAAAFLRVSEPGLAPTVWAGAAPGAALGRVVVRLPALGDEAAAKTRYALYSAQRDPQIGWGATGEPRALVSEIGALNAVHADADGTLWLGGSHGLARVALGELHTEPAARPALMPQWRFVRTSRAALATAGTTEVLPRDTVLDFGWSLPAWDRSHRPVFQTRLSGVDAEWRSPSPRSDETFARLRPGAYVFAVRAVDALGRAGPEAGYAFAIAPAWFETWLARGGFVLLGLAGIYGVVMWRTRALTRRQHALEAAVRERTEALYATNEILQAATLAKTEFVGTVSHELRNPLAGARMMADLLLRSPLPAGAQTQVTNLRGCVTYLQSLLDDTLDLTRIELGQVPIKLTQFQLGPLLAETAALFQAVAAQKGLTIAIESGVLGERWLAGEATHLKRILVNFLGNAVKFTTRGGITLTVSAVRELPAYVTLRLAAHDTGPGVPAALLPRLFSAYVRADENEAPLAERGAGLGLVISRKLAEMNGGSVGVESAPGQGATFWVELPLLPAAPAGDDQPMLTQRFAGLRVLVVDDERYQRDLVCDLLRELDVTPATAKNMTEALQMLDRTACDVVLVDFNLGGSTGVELLTTYRARLPAGTRGPIFHLITAHDSAALRASGVRAGFASCQTKPISLTALCLLLAEAGTLNAVAGFPFTPTSCPTTPASRSSSP